MNTLLKPLQVRETLLQKKVRTFTTHDFENIFRTTPTKTKSLLETQTTQGLLIRLKRGVYALKTDLPSWEEIANSLYRPSYISFEYALAYWGIMPEMPYSVTSATTKPTRKFTANNISFAYYSIKEEAYTGYASINVVRRISLKSKEVHLFETAQTGSSMGSFLIAEPEKALVDYLYFVSLGKKMENDRLSIEPGTVDEAKAHTYARLYNKKELTELLEGLL
jgi:predicted transcriptional regulator of viral defense system